MLHQGVCNEVRREDLERKFWIRMRLWTWQVLPLFLRAIWTPFLKSSVLILIIRRLLWYPVLEFPTSRVVFTLTFSGLLLSHLLSGSRLITGSSSVCYDLHQHYTRDTSAHRNFSKQFRTHPFIWLAVASVIYYWDDLIILLWPLATAATFHWLNRLVNQFQMRHVWCKIIFSLIALNVKLQDCV